ncbi:MAG TPA: TraR/DksA C4-type zinc finger protein [Actinomycetota bacterium]|nr:TraR/DksA C4-type zinc finger protein [Actinomycetota bacterium]
MTDPEVTARRRAALERRRSDLRRELAQHGADPDSDGLTFDDDAGFADRSHSTEERSRLIALVGNLRTELREVERALEKLDVGGYGVCERCGNRIGDDRLEAIPWATLCIDCKRKAAP